MTGAIAIQLDCDPTLGSSQLRLLTEEELTSIEGGAWGVAALLGAAGVALVVGVAIGVAAYYILN
jgi:lactobin A/cerein 7B family class IIb bacteriocin